MAWASTRTRALPRHSAANLSSCSRSPEQEPKRAFDKIKYNHELKLADERYLEQINGDNTLYSAYRNSTIDTKREDLTSEDTTIIGAAAELAGYSGHGYYGRQILHPDGRAKCRLVSQLSGMT